MVIINVYAFDKNSSAMYGYQIRSGSKEDFNAQMKEFEESIPFTRYYMEMKPEQIDADSDYDIVSDYDVDIFN